MTDKEHELLSRFADRGRRWISSGLQQRPHRARHRGKHDLDSEFVRRQLGYLSRSQALPQRLSATADRPVWPMQAHPLLVKYLKRIEKAWFSVS
jgi:hypothetical protein